MSKRGKYKPESNFTNSISSATNQVLHTHHHQHHQQPPLIGYETLGGTGIHYYLPREMQPLTAAAAAAAAAATVQLQGEENRSTTSAALPSTSTSYVDT